MMRDSEGDTGPRIENRIYSGIKGRVPARLRKKTPKKTAG